MDHSQTKLAMNTHTIVVDMRRDMLKSREDTDGKNLAVNGICTFCVAGQYLPSAQIQATSSVLGEQPPPPPRAYFGRGELTERIVPLAENLTPIALIGAGGIGKTSTALTVLHDDRIKQCFGEHRRFIRCDQVPATLPHFLHRLSTAIGAGVKNPEDLTTLRPFLSSREFFIVLDNAESILDPRGTNAQEIYAVVEELSQFSNICLCVTSSISTIPPACESLDVPTLSMEAAHDAFYCIYKHGERSDQINDILEQLDFHPLSVILLATVAHHNKWGTNRLAREWGRRRVDVLRTQHNKSLASTIELSLASPMFQDLGPDARELLGVVAFFPQGVDENNLSWLFPTLPNIASILDNFCVLSLAYRSGEFIAMLAPLRDYLCPKDPTLSQFLCATRDCYFDRLSADVYPSKPGFEDARWIASEDTNVEYLLDAFASADADSDSVWSAFACFANHLYWHKPRRVMLGPKIEGLPDNHPLKPQCLYHLSRLLYSFGAFSETKQILIRALRLWREQGNELQIARTLGLLAITNKRLGLGDEGISQVEEGLEIYERLGNIQEQVRSLLRSAGLHKATQPDAAEEAASRALSLSLESNDLFMVCQSHICLGGVYRDRGEAEKAINHFETALGIVSPFSWDDTQFSIHYALAGLFLGEDRFDDAHVHIEHSKSYAIDDPYNLGYAMALQARVWHRQHKLEEAKSEISRVIEVLEKLGATVDCAEV